VTWTKLSDNFSEECAGLSDAAFRLHLTGVLWTRRRRTSGWIDGDALRSSAFPAAPQALAELLTRGYWWSDGVGGYLIRRHTRVGGVG